MWGGGVWCSCSWCGVVDCGVGLWFVVWVGLFIALCVVLSFIIVIANTIALPVV